MGVNTSVVDDSRRGSLAVRPYEQARQSRKFECGGCGKIRPKSWLTLARWLDQDGHPHEREMCRKCWQWLRSRAKFF